VAWTNKSFALNKMGDYKTALEAANTAVRIDPENDVAWLNQSNVLINLKRYEKALTAIIKGFNTKAKHKHFERNAWTTKSAALLGLKRYEEALNAAKNALKFDNKFYGAWLNKVTPI
jgi:tetratricopeptide (TPR) repeat protein